MAKTRPPVVCDVGPIIHLDKLGCLDLLTDFVPLLVPRQVWSEVTRHRAQLTSSALLKAVIAQVEGSVGDS